MDKTPIKDINFTVVDNRAITETSFLLTLKASEALPDCKAGQFLHLKIPNQAAMLRRPFCLYQVSSREIKLIIAKVGRGTHMLSQLKKGDCVQAVVPIGNGFPVVPAHKKIALLGGGVGCAPLFMVAGDNPDCEVSAYLGFASQNPLQDVLQSDFSRVCKTKVASEDASVGFKGYVTDAFLQDYNAGYRPDIIFTCGTDAMMKAVQSLSQTLKIPAFGSGEVRMGCGVGACLVCTCAVKDKSGNVRHKRGCVDGPVFDLEDWIL